MKNYNVICPYCNAKAVLRPANTVYGISEHSTGRHLYVCTNWPECDAYVSAHRGDRRPMGRLANGDLRHKRILAHRAMEDYRRLTRMDKWALYLWLQGKLNMSEHQIHIANFSEDMCDRVIELCQNAVIAYKETKTA